VSFEVAEFRKKFPQLQVQLQGQSLVYFDNGASTLKHQDAIARVHQYDRFEVSNVHRGAHSLSRKGTESFESARSQVREFLGAKDDQEIIFTRGTTESINLVAHSMSSMFQAGDEIVLSPFEHHSNIVPWQELCRRTGSVLKVLPYSKNISEYVTSLEKTLSPKTRLVSFLHFSNSLGHRMPVEKMVQICKSQGVMTLIDGAQALLTEKVRVSDLGCDFYCFSGHKVFAPYGIGILYGRHEILQTLPPYQTGGSMIDRVTFAETSYADLPQKFEAGTPNISGALGLAAALKVIETDGVENYHKHVHHLRQELITALQEFPGCELYLCEAEDYCGVVSFNLKGAHPSDVGTLLDKYGVAVRAGHHCTQPLMDTLQVPGTVRVSLAPYNTQDEINYFLNTLSKVKEFF
jgi:cysteine desulfurase / selenocysteine lyase